MEQFENATGESAAENTDFATADSTPETVTDGDTAADAPENESEATQEVDGNDEAPESGEEEGADAAETAKATESATEPDPFADLDESQNFFTDDEIKNFRLPKEKRAKFTAIQQRAKELNEKVEKAGGEMALNALAPLGQLLSKPSATAEELDTFIESLADANPLVGAQVLQGAVVSLFSEPQFADEFLKYHFNSGKANLRSFEKVVKLLDEFDTDTDKIGELLKLDKAGVLDTEYARTQFAENFGESDLYNEMVAEKQAMLDRIKALEAGEGRKPEQNVNATVQRAVGDFDQDFSKGVGDAVSAIVGRVHWGDGALTKLLTATILTELRENPNYTQAVEYIEGTGRYRSGDAANLVPQTKLQLLKNAAQGRAVEYVRNLQKDLRDITVNATKAAKQVKAQQEAAKQAEQSASEPKPGVTMPNKRPLTVEEQMAEVRARYKKMMAAERAGNLGSQV